MNVLNFTISKLYQIRSQWTLASDSAVCESLNESVFLQFSRFKKTFKSAAMPSSSLKNETKICKNKINQKFGVISNMDCVKRFNFNLTIWTKRFVSNFGQFPWGLEFTGGGALATGAVEPPPPPNRFPLPVNVVGMIFCWTTLSSFSTSAPTNWRSFCLWRFL